MRIYADVLAAMASTLVFDPADHWRPGDEVSAAKLGAASSSKMTPMATPFRCFRYADMD
jgi:hypothetical protein